MKRIMKFSFGKSLYTCIAMLTALAATTPQIHASPCTPPPIGLVGWWPGEGSPQDLVGGNNGISAPNVSFGAAKVGLGFALNDTNAYVRIPASASLNVGTGAGLTRFAAIRRVARK